MKLSESVKTPLKVASQKTEVENPLTPRRILTSKKERQLFCSKSNVKFKLLSNVYISSKQ